MPRFCIRAQLSEKATPISHLAQGYADQDVSSFGLGFFQQGEALIRKRPGPFVVAGNGQDVAVDNHLLCLSSGDAFDAKAQLPLRHHDWMGAWLAVGQEPQASDLDTRIFELGLREFQEAKVLSTSKVDPDAMLSAMRALMPALHTELKLQAAAGVFLHPSALCVWRSIGQSDHADATLPVASIEESELHGKSVTVAVASPTAANQCAPQSKYEPRLRLLSGRAEAVVVSRKLTQKSWRSE